MSLTFRGVAGMHPGTTHQQPLRRADCRAAPQPLRCEYCDGPATADDFSYVALAVVCPRCIEHFTENQDEALP